MPIHGCVCRTMCSTPTWYPATGLARGSGGVLPGRPPPRGAAVPPAESAPLRLRGIPPWGGLPLHRQCQPSPLPRQIRNLHPRQNTPEIRTISLQKSDAPTATRVRPTARDVCRVLMALVSRQRLREFRDLLEGPAAAPTREALVRTFGLRIRLDPVASADRPTRCVPTWNWNLGKQLLNKTSDGHGFGSLWTATFQRRIEHQKYTPLPGLILVQGFFFL